MKMIYILLLDSDNEGMLNIEQIVYLEDIAPNTRIHLSTGKHIDVKSGLDDVITYIDEASE